MKFFLQMCIQKEKRYAIPKNIRFEVYKLTKTALILSSPIFMERANLEGTMSDVDSVAKQSLERKRHSQVVNI